MKDFHVRRGAQWIVISLFLTVAGCGGDSGTNGNGGNGNGNDPEPVAAMDVTVGNNFFDPASIQVSPGTTVTWTWAGGSFEGHNVTFISSAVSAPSDTQMTGNFQVAMPTAATLYIYQCTIHAWMTGSVTVQ